MVSLTAQSQDLVVLLMVLCQKFSGLGDITELLAMYPCTSGYVHVALYPHTFGHVTCMCICIYMPIAIYPHEHLSMCAYQEPAH